MQSALRSLERKTRLLTAVLFCQVLATLFFVIDVAGDVAEDGLGRHISIELGATLALVAGVLTGAFHVRSLIERTRQDQATISAARGAMTTLIEARFAEWRLTAAEADVALFAIKGMEIGQIAALRGSAQGTVRAQLTRIYAKAGATSQTGLIALFMDDLIDPARRLSDAAGLPDEVRHD